MIKKLLYILFLFVPVFVTAQEYNYVHYNTKDGLAGSTVYDECQDKDGFILFATENGLSRYDGTNFKNYTVKDGLPDNEVLKLFTDSRGRTWIGSFNKELCYYYKGKIYNKTNDSLVKKINLKSVFASAAEADDGTIALCDSRVIVLITPDKYRNEKINYTSIPGKSSVAIFFSCIGPKIIAMNDFYDTYTYDGESFQYFYTAPAQYRDIGKENASFGVHMNCGGKIDRLLISKPGILSGASSNNYVTFLNTTNGVWQVDTTNNKWAAHLLPGKKVIRTITDNEKNLWFATLGEGVYKLPSAETQTVKQPHQDNEMSTAIFSLAAYQKKVLGGLEYGKALFVENNKEPVVTKYLGKPSAFFRPQNNRLYTTKTLSGNITMLGFDFHLVKLEKNIATYNDIFPIKSIEKINEEYIIVGTSGYAFKIRVKDLKITDTIWRERCTKVFYHNSKYYIGTINGLYEVDENKTYKYLGNLHPALRRRITDIKAAGDGTLWIATSDDGIVAYKNNSIAAAIKDSNGLSSNICKTLFLHQNYLWAGTNKGLNKIDINNASYPVLKYSISDGLPSDIINAIYIEDSIVYVGSPAGLTYFNENKISNTSSCNLQMLNVEVSKKEMDTSGNYKLPYKNNNIRFAYVAVSFKSGGDITYHYKLNGLDNSWNLTSQTTLEYPALPPGDYELQLYAVNKFGVQSKTIKINFAIAAPFWKTWWFYGILLIAAIIATAILVNNRNKKYRKKLEEANHYQKQLAVLEQQALQSQMNPHFIFNCLNSIQQYILTNDKEKANQYLTGFASLIRQTLDISSQKTITVTEEASYLKKYLKMEQMRFGDSFNYTINIDETVNADDIQMPALLLQPYVENSLRHGIRYKEDAAGKVEISFLVKGDNLYCTIKDNGVGRDKAAAFKSKQHIEYQSKGMGLTGKRIDLLNAINENKISVAITDLKNNDGNATGTLVEIKIPT